MVKKEFNKTFIICFIALVIGGVAMGLSHLSGFLDVLGFVLLLASYLGMVTLFTIWHLHIKKPNKICITSIIHMAISIAVFIIGSCFKITFICVVSGFFIAYHLIALIVGAVLAIERYVDDLEYKRDTTWEDEDKIKNNIDIKIR